jgi:uncharacterized RDD family membrane protein YckC
MLASSGAPGAVPTPDRGREWEAMADEPMSTPGASPPASSPGIPGFVYADVPNRFIALIIDAIVMFLILIVIGIILAAVGFNAGVLATGTNIVSGIVYAALSLVVTGGYFIYTWTSMRASVGMRVLGMQVGNAFDGKTLTMEQAMKRFIALWGPSTLSGALNSVSGIGQLISLAVLLYLVYLLYTTAKSPTKQGFHDIFANTVVVKAARTAG